MIGQLRTSVVTWLISTRLVGARGPLLFPVQFLGALSGSRLVARSNPTGSRFFWRQPQHARLALLVARTLSVSTVATSDTSRIYHASVYPSASSSPFDGSSAHVLSARAGSSLSAIQGSFSRVLGRPTGFTKLTVPSGLLLVGNLVRASVPYSPWRLVQTRFSDV
jgi:hypothetical protein